MSSRSYEAANETEDKSQISFQDNVWLRSFPLVSETALDYFALSPFYQRSCSNEQCRMQGLDPSVAMKNMIGIEYAVEDVVRSSPNDSDLPQSTLIIISKQYRKSKTQVEARGIYYILDGIIYQAPSAYSLIISRLQKSAFMLGEAFADLQKYPNWNLEGGYTWKWNEHSKNPKPLGEVGDKTSLNLTAGVNDAILHMVKKYAPHDDENWAAINDKNIIMEVERNV